jgi:hypothetical protein
VSAIGVKVSVVLAAAVVAEAASDCGDRLPTASAASTV